MAIIFQVLAGKKPYRHVAQPTFCEMSDQPVCEPRNAGRLRGARAYWTYLRFYRDSPSTDMLTALVKVPATCAVGSQAFMLVCSVVE